MITTDIKYRISIDAAVSAHLTARELALVSRAFESEPRGVMVYINGEHLHDFEMFAGEKLADLAEAQLQDLELETEITEGVATAKAFLVDIATA